MLAPERGQEAPSPAPALLSKEAKIVFYSDEDIIVVFDKIVFYSDNGIIAHTTRFLIKRMEQADL